MILFFLAQFTNYFTYSNLDRMLAYAGGQALFKAALPTPLLLVIFVVLVIFADFATWTRARRSPSWADDRADVARALLLHAAEVPS